MHRLRIRYTVPATGWDVYLLERAEEIRRLGIRTVDQEGVAETLEPVHDDAQLDGERGGAHDDPVLLFITPGTGRADR